MGKKVAGEGSNKVTLKRVIANFWDKDKGLHPLIQLKVNGTFASILLDTGSSTTLVKEDFLPHLLETGNGKLLRIKRDNCQLYAVTGDQLEVVGKIPFRVQVGKRHIKHTAIVIRGATFSGDILAGTDLMRRWGTISFDWHPRSSGLRISGERHPFTEYRGHSYHVAKKSLSVSDQIRQNVSKIVAGDKIRLEPRSFSVVNVKVHPQWIGKEVVVEDDLHIDGVKLGASICLVGADGEIPISMANYLDADFSLHKNQILGEVKPVVTESDDLHSHDIDPEEKTDFSKIELSHLSPQEQKQVSNLLEKYNDIFAQSQDDLGFCGMFEHEIDTGTHAPVNIPQYRLPHKTKEIIEEQVQQMLRMGVIKPCESPWNSPVILVKKPNGKHRFVVDLRGVNKVTTKCTTLMPRIDEILESLGSASHFTCLDTRSGFWQIPIREADRIKTSFTTPSGTYSFQRTPFGLFGSPNTFCKTMSCLFASVIGKFAHIYLDDLIIYSSDFQQHLSHVREIFDIYRKSGVKLSFEKCHWAKRSLKYLGHIISSEGISTNPEKVQAIRQYAQPTTSHQVRQFMGLAGYYRKFVPFFSELATPLTDLTRKNVKFKWTDLVDRSFNALKDALCNAPVLIYPDFTKSFNLHTDASGTAIGSALTQLNEEGLDMPIAYFSRKLSVAEKNYTVTELEALAIVESIKHFRYYLFGRHFTVFTDHAALQYLFKFKSNVPRIARWALLLTEYDWDIRYKTGKSHVIPDALSRSINAVTAARAHAKTPVVFSDAFSSKNVYQAQPHDPSVAYMRDYYHGQNCGKNSFLSKKELVLRDNCLGKNEKTRNGMTFRVIVPEELKLLALELAHSSHINCHAGVWKTLKKAESMFIWENMKRDVEHYVKKCLTCLTKSPYGRVKAPVQPFADIHRPMEWVSVDLVGPFVESDSGNKYLLTCICHFSRYLHAIPLPDIRKETVLDAFVKYINTFGIPNHITTDRGTQFTSHIFRDVCEDLRVKLHYTTSFHPASNGKIERSHRTFKDALFALIQGKFKSWDSKVPFATFAVNCSFHKSIQDIPYFVFFGRDANLPISDIVNNSGEESTKPENYRTEIIPRMKKAFKRVYDCTKAAQERAIKYTKPVGKLFRVGEIVLLRNMYKVGTMSKFLPRWVGPFRIVEKIGEVNYRIKRLFGNQKTLVVHANLLKHGGEPLSQFGPNNVASYRNNSRNSTPCNDDNSEGSSSANSPSSSDSESEEDILYPVPVSRAEPRTKPEEVPPEQASFGPATPPPPEAFRYALRSRGSVPSFPQVQDRPIEFKKNALKTVFSTVQAECMKEAVNFVISNVIG